MAKVASQMEAEEAPPVATLRPGAPGAAFFPKAPEVPQPERALPSAAPPERFSFAAADGRVFTSTKDVADVVTPGLLRQFRNDEIEFAFRALELLFDDNPEAMSAIDSSWANLGTVTRALRPFIERSIRVGLGE